MKQPAPTPQVVEELLEPISDEEPAGSWLGHDGIYEQVQDARREDDPSLPPGVWEKPLKVSEYPRVAALCADAIRRRSKDLRLAAWLADAWAYVHGLQGLVRGLELFTRLYEKYWDSAFPRLERADDEARAQIVDWLDIALAGRLRATKIGQDESHAGLLVAELVGREGQPGITQRPAPDSILGRMSLVGDATWFAVHEHVAAALNALTRFESLLTAASVNESGLRRLGAELRTLEILCERSVATLAGSSGGFRRANATEAPLNGERQDHAQSMASDMIASRADAYRVLSEAADYLLRTEPHSPVPYLVKRAIAWGNLDLVELLKEFISRSDDLVAAHRLLGMRQTEE